jgi:hypothetical protein
VWLVFNFTRIITKIGRKKMNVCANFENELWNGKLDANLRSISVRMSNELNWLGVRLCKIYCILASCYIRLTLNICSFVRQCTHSLLKFY